MRTEDEMIAYALEAEPELLPYIPALLTDLDELGSDAELIVDILKHYDLPKTTKVLDLGCGKGAVAVEIADELGWEVTGIDLFLPFVDAARVLAAKEDVAQLCQFEQGNIRTAMNGVVA